MGPIGNCQINPPSGSEIFVSRIPLHYTEVELFKIFSTVGNIFKLRIMLRECRSTFMYNRGFAYITYTTPEAAERAVNEITAQNNKYTGKYLTVELSHDNCRLFVGGIPEHKTKDEVWKQLLMSGFEGIVEIIMYRAYTNRTVNRGFVFVEFETHQKAAQARYLFQNLKLWDTKLTVNWSTPLPKLDSVTLANITKLFFRNMSVTELLEEFKATLTHVLDGMPLRKVYKFKDQAFVHFYNRNEAEEAMEKLTGKIT
nr:probable RNA-binding protein 46 [Onthophagus taurus]